MASEEVNSTRRLVAGLEPLDPGFEDFQHLATNEDQGGQINHQNKNTPGRAKLI